MSRHVVAACCRLVVSPVSLLLHDPYSVCGNLNQFLLTITIVRPACPPPDTPGALFTKQSRPSPVARSRAPGRETNPILLGRRRWALGNVPREVWSTLSHVVSGPYYQPTDNCC